MLTLLGILTIVALLLLVLFRVTSVLVALTLVPVVAALVGGSRASGNVRHGRDPQRDAGRGAPRVRGRLFRGDERRRSVRADIRTLLGLVGSDRCRIAVGTAAVASVAHLDGAGASTFMVTVPAILPLYRRVP